MDENFTTTEGHNASQCEALLPNGGWDVHHHIFERELEGYGFPGEFC
jgi:hypothetical protein